MSYGWHALGTESAIRVLSRSPSLFIESCVHWVVNEVACFFHPHAFQRFLDNRRCSVPGAYGRVWLPNRYSHHLRLSTRSKRNLRCPTNPPGRFFSLLSGSPCNGVGVHMHTATTCRRDFGCCRMNHDFVALCCQALSSCSFKCRGRGIFACSWNGWKLGIGKHSYRISSFWST